MLNCPLIEAEVPNEQAFEPLTETDVNEDRSDELSSEFPWLEAAGSGNDLYEFTKNLGGNNGSIAFNTGN